MLKIGSFINYPDPEKGIKYKKIYDANSDGFIIIRELDVNGSGIPGVSREYIGSCQAAVRVAGNRIAENLLQNQFFS